MDQKKPSLKKIVEKIRYILDETHYLAELHPEVPENKRFVRVLEGTYRRNTYTLLAKDKLAQYPELADSALTLTRKMIEHTICIDK
jgi:hypothetical protein